jgi:hypothetical protein
MSKSHKNYVVHSNALWKQINLGRKQYNLAKSLDSYVYPHYNKNNMLQETTYNWQTATYFERRLRNGTGSIRVTGWMEGGGKFFEIISLFVWLVAGADLFWEKSTAGWLLVAGLFWEKSTAGWWLISQTNRAGRDITRPPWNTACPQAVVVLMPESPWLKDQHDKEKKPLIITNMYCLFFSHSSPPCSAQLQHSCHVFPLA